jgi:hypothetical protein
MELYLHSPTCLHGAHTNNFNFTVNLQIIRCHIIFKIRKRVLNTQNLFDIKLALQLLEVFYNSLHTLCLCMTKCAVSSNRINT